MYTICLEKLEEEKACELTPFLYLFDSKWLPKPRSGKQFHFYGLFSFFAFWCWQSLSFIWKEQGRAAVSVYTIYSKQSQVYMST